MCQQVRIARETAGEAVPTGRAITAKIGPFGKVALAKDDRACRAQPCDHWRIAARDIVAERERSSGRRHIIRRFDIILQKDWNPVEQSAHPPAGALSIKRACLRNDIRIGYNHRADRWPGIINRRNP